MSSQQIYRLIHDLYVAVDAADREFFAQFELTQSQFRLLTLLSEVPSSHLITLSDQLLCARSTVTRLTDYLEQRGWVERSDDDHDRRAQRVSLTKVGRTWWEHVNAHHSHALEAYMQSINPDERIKLRGLLEKMTRGFSKT